MARPDPRAEPVSIPPTQRRRDAPDHSVERVVVARIDAVSEPASEAEEPAPPSSSVTSADPRIAEIEPLVARNDWKAIADLLGSLDAVGKLPPNLGLLAALAHNEVAKDGNADARDVATRCMAALLGMPASGEIASVVARRLLRKNPVAFRKRPAPPARTSALIVVVVLAVGGALGWFLSSPIFTRLMHH
jgi:hypothetical protein